MSLQIKFSVTLSSSCKGFTITDTTGSYNADINPTGWGTPNPAIGDIAEGVLSIENLTTETVYDNLEFLPDEVGYSQEYTTEDLEVAGVSIGDVTLPDGLYCFTITYTMDDESEYQNAVSKVFLCESCCKIKTKACDIDLECGCCNDPCAEEIWKFLQAWTELKVIEYSAYCSSNSNINNKIKSLQSFLTTFDCSNCN